MARLAKARLSPVSKPRHINYIFTVNTPILYIYIYIYRMFTSYGVCQTLISDQGGEFNTQLHCVNWWTLHSSSHQYMGPS